MSDGGKGDTRRPTLIEKKEFEDNGIIFLARNLY